MDALDAAIKWRNKTWDDMGIIKTERQSIPIIEIRDYYVKKERIIYTYFRVIWDNEKGERKSKKITANNPDAREIAFKAWAYAFNKFYNYHIICADGTLDSVNVSDQTAERIFIDKYGV
jgi:hypothetical protein